MSQLNFLIIVKKNYSDEIQACFGYAVVYKMLRKKNRRYFYR